MIEQRWALFLLGWALAAAVQAILYVRLRQTRDATLVDAGWRRYQRVTSLFAPLPPRRPAE